MFDLGKAKFTASTHISATQFMKISPQSEFQMKLCHYFFKTNTTL